MTGGIAIHCVLCFILTQIFVLNIVESDFSDLYNTTGHEFLQNAVRAKRSAFENAPTILRVKIQYESNEKITELILFKQMNILASQYLPVVARLPNPDRNVMDDVGEFVMYQDVEECCAVVYFVKARALYGTIGMSHFIHAIPFAFDASGEYQLGIVGEPFVRKNTLQYPHINPATVFPPPFDTDAWEDFLDVYKNIERINKRPATCEPGPSAKRPRTDPTSKKGDGGETSGNMIPSGSAKRFIFDNFFFECLVLVTRDLAQLFKIHFGDDYVAAIVRYHIIFFNAVDTLTTKLGNFQLRVHINIAKIVIEDDLTPFGFMSDREAQFTDIVTGVTEYLHNNRKDYPPDSFDYVFIHTSRTIMDYTMKVKALTKHGRDMYEARRRNIPYEAVPITVMKFSNYYAHYTLAAHEIGRTFNMKLTSKEVGLQSTEQCHDIMQRGGPKCENCLKWSDVDQELYRQFFTYNRNRCFLLNQPRSSRPPGTSRFITPHQQCQCFGYNSYVTDQRGHPKILVGVKGCKEPLKCKTSSALNWNHESTILPLDGTSCSTDKVCWNGLCEKLPMIPSTSKIVTDSSLN